MPNPSLMMHGLDMNWRPLANNLKSSPSACKLRMSSFSPFFLEWEVWCTCVPLTLCIILNFKLKSSALICKERICTQIICSLCIMCRNYSYYALKKQLLLRSYSGAGAQLVTRLILTAIWAYVSPFPWKMEWVFAAWVSQSFGFMCLIFLEWWSEFLLPEYSFPLFLLILLFSSWLSIAFVGHFSLSAWACLVSNQVGAWSSKKEERARDLSHVTERKWLSQGNQCLLDFRWRRKEGWGRFTYGHVHHLSYGNSQKNEARMVTCII